MKTISKSILFKKYLVQMFYENLIDEELTAEEVFENFWLIDQQLQEKTSILDENDKQEALKTLSYAFDEKDQNIKIISKYLKDTWDFKRLPKTEQSILLLSVSHMFHSEITDVKQFIQDYLELSKMFCEYKSLPFIISVLNNIATDFNIGDPDA